MCVLVTASSQTLVYRAASKSVMVSRFIVINILSLQLLNVPAFASSLFTFHTPESNRFTQLASAVLISVMLVYCPGLVTHQGTQHIILDGVFHSMSRIGTFGEKAERPWYGSCAAIDAWLSCLVDQQ